MLYAIVLAALTPYLAGTTAPRPPVSIAAPAPGARVDGPVALRVAVAPGTRVRKLSFLADSRTFAAAESPPYTATWDPAGAAPGRHELKAHAELADGRTLIDRVEVVTGRPSEPLFVGDFTTGDLSQWQGDFTALATVGGARLRVVRAPDGAGFAARFEVRQGDQPVAAGGDRNEVINQDRLVNGVVDGDGPRYYAWETYLPDGYPGAAGYQTITQWHQSQIPAPSPLKVMLTADSTRFDLRARSAPDVPDEVLASVPATRGEWHAFVVGVDWSADPREGWVEAWVDGNEVLPRTHRATQYRMPDGTAVFNHFKQGLYRDAGIVEAQALLLRGTRIGLTRASVTGRGGG